MSYYGSLTEARDYFASKLYRDLWHQTDPDNQVRALNDATERIDRLNYAGSRTLATQTLQFPRDGSDEVPLSIRRATYEVAFQLLDGADPEVMYTLLRRAETQVGPNRSRNDTRLIPEHIANGIPSLLAWSYIKPYLRDRSRIHLQRS